MVENGTMVYPALQTIRDEHNALAAMVRSLSMLVDRGPQREPERFFEVVRAMLFYIDEFPERLHHPKESNHLFPKVARVAPELIPVLHRLESDHLSGERRVRELQHLLTAWELLGESRHEAFVAAAHDYVRFQLAHIELEESQVLPAAQKLLAEPDWQELDNVFSANADPVASGATRHPAYDRLFSRIVQKAPAPIGVGDE
jgi:hemerythrin-like domain-containing protein